MLISLLAHQTIILMTVKIELSTEQAGHLLKILEFRFAKNMHRHRGLQWNDIQIRLDKNSSKLWSLQTMEDTGGEPDVVGYESSTDMFIFCDCSPETPKGRRSVCYDPEALDSRKEHKPKHSAIGMASEMGIEILTKDQYFALQQLDEFDKKTSSWLQTPAEIRNQGGAIFGDRRYGRVFIYHNGAESYYAVRGFRGLIRV
jgi:hypothetical protein